MHLLIIRHGEIEHSSPDSLGPALSLSGRQDLEKLRAFLQLQGAKPENLLVSPMRRAQQTAELLNQDWGLNPEDCLWLRPGVTVSEMETGLLEAQVSQKNKLALVSHQPALGHFLSHLLWSGQGAAFHLVRGGAVSLDYDPISRQAKLDWMISPDLLG